MTTTIGDLLVRIVKERDEALAAETAAERQQLALGVLETAMFTLHKLLGTDLLTAMLGDLEGADRGVILETAARRIFYLSTIFGKMPLDAAAPFKVVEEAMAIARGDAPLMFARLDGQKVNHRIGQAKFGALKWDAYLRGRGLPPGKRHALIAEAYGAPWDTIRRAWKRDVVGLLSQESIAYLLQSAEVEGRLGVPRWEMLGSDDWEATMAADGRRYQFIVRENNGNL